MVFGRHVYPQIVIAMETMWTRLGVEACNLSSCFLGIALARESGKSGNGILRWLFGRLCLTSFPGIRQTHVCNADVVFECQFVAVALATTDAIPSIQLGGFRKIGFAADEPFLALVDRADVDGQVALLGEALPATRNGAGEDLSFFESNVAMGYLEVLSQSPCCGTYQWTFGA